MADEGCASRYEIGVLRLARGYSTPEIQLYLERLEHSVEEQTGRRSPRVLPPSESTLVVNVGDVDDEREFHVLNRDHETTKEQARIRSSETDVDDHLAKRRREFVGENEEHLPCHRFVHLTRMIMDEMEILLQQLDYAILAKESDVHKRDLIASGLTYVKRFKQTQL